MIVMFGDHHGDVGSDFYEELYGKKLIDVEGEQYETRYETPFSSGRTMRLGKKQMKNKPELFINAGNADG